MILQQESRIKSEVVRPTEIAKKKDLNRVILGDDKLT